MSKSLPFEQKEARKNVYTNIWDVIKKGFFESVISFDKSGFCTCDIDERCKSLFKILQCFRYMLGEVHYGGRVTDDFDKILLNTFCTVWFNERVFSEEFNFYKGYKIVKFKNVADYLNYIETFPAIDPPQAYGLHSNADIT